MLARNWLDIVWQTTLFKSSENEWTRLSAPEYIIFANAIDALGILASDMQVPQVIDEALNVSKKFFGVVV